MNLNKLGKKIKGEITSSPKKTAVLGLMSLVALYFWGPLILDWLPGDKTAGGNTPAASTTPDVTAAAVVEPLRALPTVGMATAKKDYLWNDLIGAIDRDRYMSTAIWHSHLRDPFQSIATLPSDDRAADDTAEDDPQQNSQPQRDYSPGELRLVLESVVIGPRYSMATINGKSYRKGTSIVAAGSPSTTSGDATAKTTTSEIVFTLMEVHPRSVDLFRGEKTYTLQLKQPKLAGDDRMTLHKASLSRP